MDIAPPTHLSLCAGYEGIGIGLKRVFPSCRTIAAVEAEAFCAANLVDKMETGALAPMPVFTDITQFDGSPFRGLVDIASGGFPCTPFSCAGLRESDGSENHLFPYILKTIKATEPSIVFLENVEGIISSKLKGDHWNDPAGTPVLLHVCRELERVGYASTWGIFSAVECGATQQRKRVFILGVANSLGSRAPSWFPEPQQWEKRYTEILNHRSAGNWPARPGEPQHEWEEYRLVANPDSGEPSPKRGHNGEVPQVSREQGEEHRAPVPCRDRDEGGTGLADSNTAREHQPKETGDEEGERPANGCCSKRGDMAHTQRSIGSCRSGLCEIGEPDGSETSGRRPEDQGANVEYTSGREAIRREAGDVGEKEQGGESAHAAISNSSGRSIKSQLGRAADGAECRVDAAFARVERLRMLGNGVVPITSARALAVMLNEFYG